MEKQEGADRMDANVNDMSGLSNNIRKLRRLVLVLGKDNQSVFEYTPETDRLCFYDSTLMPLWDQENYMLQMQKSTVIHPEDCELWKKLLTGEIDGSAEIRMIDGHGSVMRKLVDVPARMQDEDTVIGSFRDVTVERRHEEYLRDRAARDSLTQLYNHDYGKGLINEYLRTKDPYSSCALLIIDLDYFKNANDVYGHLFGESVLVQLSRLLTMMFRRDDVLMRAGGDEFVILLKNISHAMLVKKIMQLLTSVREMSFQESDYSLTCSIGVCFLPENVSGYTYDQLFGNADWALYRAKERGRNRYEFCDNLQRFENFHREEAEEESGIDARYLRNDIVSTAFEIFEKTSSFDAAVELLLRVVGRRFQLDRVVVLRTDIREGTTRRQYQWCAPGVSRMSEEKGSFNKEDFLTLFHSFDEFGTTVVHSDAMQKYSERAEKNMMQDGAKTVLYAAMYCEGKYTGAIAYETCKDKHYWSSENRSELGEVAKILSAHLAKKLAMNESMRGVLSSPDYDPLTGLLSFARFREEVERKIVGEDVQSYIMIYTDIENFKFFNQRYGYIMGDHLLKDLANYIIGRTRSVDGIYFARVVSDQFLMFRPYTAKGNAAAVIHELNQEFVRQQSKRFPDIHLRLRSGIYFIEPDCHSASAAIDAANYARKQIPYGSEISARVYDHDLDRKLSLENEIVNGMADAMKNHEFKVYLQPKFSLDDFSIVGAEALVRWERPDGTLLYPDAFIPLYERSGRIEELDFYVFEEVARFLAKNKALGRRQIPISINASILHASDENAVRRYQQILEKYGVDPSLTEIELTETAAAEDYDNVRGLFRRLQEANMKTSLDDFGAGYSILNTVIDIPVNTVKIDRIFMGHCEENEKGIYFLEQVVALVKGLGCNVLCEGVETDRQIAILKKAGCEEAQGYWFARPMPIDKFEEMAYKDEPSGN